MSNPEPNLNRSARWHRPAIWGIITAVVLAVLALLFTAPWQTEDVDVSRQTEESAPAPVAEGTDETAVEPAPPAGPVTAPASD